jgi:hypothetical protein
MSEDAVIAHAVASLPRRRVAWRAARIRARLRRRKLDEALAGGVDPWTSSELVARATQVTSPTTRHRLAGSVDALIVLAEHGGLNSPSVPIPRRAVLAKRDALAALAMRLRDPAPVGVAGLARLAGLLWDGSSPLYDSAASDEAIRDAIAGCLELLEPALPARL